MCQGVGIATRQFFLWLKPSFEDENGKASSRKLSGFAVVFVYCVTRIIFTITVTNATLKLQANTLDAVFAGLLFGFITAQQIMTFFRRRKSEERLNNNTSDRTPKK